MIPLIFLIPEFWSAVQTEPLDRPDYCTSWAWKLVPSKAWLAKSVVLDETKDLQSLRRSSNSLSFLQCSNENQFPHQAICQVLGREKSENFQQGCDVCTVCFRVQGLDQWPWKFFFISQKKLTPLVLHPLVTLLASARCWYFFPIARWTECIYFCCTFSFVNLNKKATISTIFVCAVLIFLSSQKWWVWCLLFLCVFLGETWSWVRDVCKPAAHANVTGTLYACVSKRNCACLVKIGQLLTLVVSCG